MSDDPMPGVPLITTSVPVHPLLARRWTARALDPDAPVSDEDLLALLEAARLAPSALNHQPWRFVVARRETPAFAAVLGSLADYNAVWAADAAAFVVGAAELAGPDGDPRPWSLYDLGQATAHLTVEATARGVNVCQMAGFDALRLQEVLGLDDVCPPQIVSALGRPTGWRPLAGQDARHRKPLHEVAREIPPAAGPRR